MKQKLPKTQSVMKALPKAKAPAAPKAPKKKKPIPKMPSMKSKIR